MTVRAPGRYALFGLTALCVLTMAVGCTSGSAARPDESRSTPSSSSPSTGPPTQPTLPASADPAVTVTVTAAADAAAVHDAVTRFNAADADVAAQQQVLVRLVDPAQRDVQRRCPAATATLEFQPVWSALAPAPGWQPSAGSLTGTVYSLPTLIRVHRAGRVTGTDLTDLHLAVSGAGAARSARLVALCIS